MKLITTTLPFEELFPKENDKSLLVFFHENQVFFDIETYNEIQNRNIIYEISFAVYKNDAFIIKQALSERPEDEKEILNAFLKELPANATLISYNGLTFDKNVILKRINECSIDDNLKNRFSNAYHYDFYKEVRPFKKIFKLTSCKLTDIENFLGIHRDDEMSGFELMKMVPAYFKSHEETLERMLLLHNFDDVVALILLTRLNAYFSAFEGVFSVDSVTTIQDKDMEGNATENLLIMGTLQIDIPKTISVYEEGFYLIMENKNIKLSTPILDGKIKLPFLDYKNYVYLPDEDMAVLSTIASSVEPSKKTPATPKTCYGKFQVTEENILKLKTYEKYLRTVLSYLKLIVK